MPSLLRIMGIETELDEMKRKAAKLYLAANDFDDLSCGRQVAEHIRPRLAIARQEFSALWSKVREIDPSAPADPFTV